MQGEVYKEFKHFLLLGAKAPDGKIGGGGGGKHQSFSIHHSAVSTAPVY